MPTDPARRTLGPAQIEEAFQAVPPHEVAEIIDGELVVRPRRSAVHANAASDLVEQLRGPFQKGRAGPGGWIILAEPELHLGPKPDKLVPDLAGWRRTRMPELPDVAAFTLAPDWVCEVLSERTEHDDRTRKRRIYRREGVAHLWLLDPLERTLEIYRLVEGRWLEVETIESGERVRAEPFDAIELDLAALWAR